VKIAGEIIDHQVAIEYILAILLSANHGVLKDKSEISAVGHRVVHGGEKFKCSVLIDNEVMEKLQDCVELAPLHNPHNIKGIRACHTLLPGIPQVGVFDTAFHSTIPDFAYIYGLPFLLYKRYAVRRYGFHGTSHFYVSLEAATLMGKSLEELKLITCHLGNGCSIAAIDKGKSVDTSMGFTPVEGLLMGTRCGDIDPAAVLYIMNREELTMDETNALLNKHSGLQGISGVSSDMREIIEETVRGNKQAELALNVFCYRLKKYIGGYAVAMGGLDCIVFTGGIGERAKEVRRRTTEGMEFLGLKIDLLKNEALFGERGFFNSEDSAIKALVIPTNEELVIAIDTENIIKNLKP
jgi:acetate kinase